MLGSLINKPLPFGGEGTALNFFNKIKNKGKKRRKRFSQLS